MPEIKGFSGWRYNPKKVRDLAKVLAPPYDVISPKGREGFYQKSPYNVIRLILGKEKRGDTAGVSKYSRARDFFKQWITEDILTEDADPSIYVYAQNYRQDSKPKLRLGFIAAMKLDESAILRHENTLAAPKKDRLALLKEVRTNLSPIFGLFEDKKGRVQGVLKKSLQKKSPALDVTIDGVRHRLFVEASPKMIQAIVSELRPKPMLIADGHHRLEVAFQFKEWLDAPKDAPSNYVMTYFSDCDHNPFDIFPTHRLLKTPGNFKNPLAALEKRGSLKKVPRLFSVLSALSRPRSRASRGDYRFGIFTKKEGFFLFRLADHFLDFSEGNPVQRLDVAVLHRCLIEPVFRIQTIEKSNRIDFTRNAEEAVQKVKKGEWDVAIFLRPTSLAEMIEVSKKGLKMPQKSTYFYPKLLSGLVFHRLEKGPIR